MATLFQGRKLLVKHSGGVRPAPLDALHGKVVLLYFSASWCGPCHQFTPILKDFYEELVDREDTNFEIVYVPGDRSLEEMMQYYQNEHADYLALDISDTAFIQYLNQRYGVRGIPSCVVVQPDGTVIDGDARTSVQSGGPSAAFRRWRTAWNSGTTVVIQGLVGAAQHNGKPGRLVKFDHEKSRFVVALSASVMPPPLSSRSSSQLRAVRDESASSRTNDCTPRRPNATSSSLLTASSSANANSAFSVRASASASDFASARRRACSERCGFGVSSRARASASAAARACSARAALSTLVEALAHARSSAVAYARMLAGSALESTERVASPALVVS